MILIIFTITAVTYADVSNDGCRHVSNHVSNDGCRQQISGDIAAASLCSLR